MAGKCLLDPVFFACAEVVAHDGLAALADSLEGQGHQLAAGGDDGHGPHGHVTAVAGEAAVEADIQKTFRAEHHKGGDPKGQAGKDYAGLQFQA